MSDPTYEFYWEDFTTGFVREFGPVTVEADAIVDFARQFDPQPFHLSEEAGRASLFGGLAASGWHTASLTMRLMCDGIINKSASLGSPGLEGLKWLKPVLAGPLKAVFEAKCAVIAAWVAAGKLRPVDPPHLIFAIWALTQHYADFAVQVRALTSKSLADRAFMEETRSAVTNLVLRGVAAAAT